jgi:hypothetical protein
MDNPKVAAFRRELIDKHQQWLRISAKLDERYRVAVRSICHNKTVVTHILWRIFQQVTSIIDRCANETVHHARRAPSEVCFIVRSVQPQ